MEKNTATICLHDLAGLLRNLQEHIIEPQIQADQLAQLKQGMKFPGLLLLGMEPGPILAPA